MAKIFSFSNKNMEQNQNKICDYDIPGRNLKEIKPFIFSDEELKELDDISKKFDEISEKEGKLSFSKGVAIFEEWFYDLLVP